MATTEIRTAVVDLSGYHAGQAVQENAIMRAKGQYHPVGRNVFGRIRYTWRAAKWQAKHVTIEADRSRREVVSPWLGSIQDAEVWLKGRGLRLGGAYWHSARAE